CCSSRLLPAARCSQKSLLRTGMKARRKARTRTRRAAPAPWGGAARWRATGGGGTSVGCTAGPVVSATAAVARSPSAAGCAEGCCDAGMRRSRQKKKIGTPFFDSRALAAAESRGSCAPFFVLTFLAAYLQLFSQVARHD